MCIRQEEKNFCHIKYYGTNFRDNSMFGYYWRTLREKARNIPNLKDKSEEV